MAAAQPNFLPRLVPHLFNQWNRTNNRFHLRVSRSASRAGSSEGEEYVKSHLVDSSVSHAFYSLGEYPIFVEDGSSRSDGALLTTPRDSVEGSEGSPTSPTSPALPYQPRPAGPFNPLCWATDRLTIDVETVVRLHRDRAERAVSYITEIYKSDRPRALTILSVLYQGRTTECDTYAYIMAHVGNDLQLDLKVVLRASLTPSEALSFGKPIIQSILRIIWIAHVYVRN